MPVEGIFSISYYEDFVINKFSADIKGLLGIGVSDQVAQNTRELPLLNDPKKRFSTYNYSREELYLTPSGVVAVTRAPRHQDFLLPSFRLLALNKKDLAALAEETKLPFKEDKIIIPERYFG